MINIPTVVVLSSLLIINPTGNTTLIPATSLPATQIELASDTMPLNDRYPVASVNQVFKDNILLDLAYLKGDVKDPKNIDWQKIEQPTELKFTLKPGQTFAFHDGVLPEYANPAVVGTSHFGPQDGYKSDGYLYGDGVCHLASLFNWAAQDAGLKVDAPTNHNFMPIPDIAKQYGTAIYYMPGETGVNAKENLYITNIKDKDVTFDVTYSSEAVNVSIVE